MEIASLVLGVLPILVSAVEHYDHIRKLFARYRKFDDEFHRFQRGLGTQYALYRTEVNLLLRRVLGQEQATQMLEDPKHQLWRDTSVDSRIKKHLGLNGPSSVEIVQTIEELLRGIREKEKYFAAASAEKHNVSCI